MQIRVQCILLDFWRVFLSGRRLCKSELEQQPLPLGLCEGWRFFVGCNGKLAGISAQQWRRVEEATIPGAQLFAVFDGKICILCTTYGNTMQER